MTVTERALEQGKALAKAIESVETIESTGPIERVPAWFLLQAYRRRRRAIAEAPPDWLAEVILSASHATVLGQPLIGPTLLSQVTRR